MKLAFPLSLRALVLGAVLSAIVAMCSAFAGLQARGVYWPIVTTSLISMAVLKALGGTDSNEINIMQTAASTGGLLAAGVIFTVPAAFLLGFNLSAFQIMLVALVGGTIGIVFTAPLRRQMIEKEQLPYADGAAAAAMLKAGDSGGKKARALLGSFGIGAAYSGISGLTKLVPPVISFPLSEKVGISSLTSVIPFAGGFLIGPKFTAAWFAGTIVGLYLALSNPGIRAFQLGIGIIIGASLAYFVVRGLPTLKHLFRDWGKAKTGRLEGVAIIAAVGVLTIITQLNIALAIIALVGSFLMAFVAARVTGEMNVDPLEVFAFIVMLAAKVLIGFGGLPLVILTAVVAIAAGMAGDFMQDLKSGHLLGTRPEHQMLAQAVGLVSAALVIGVVIVSLHAAYGFGDKTILPAPQAMALKGIIQQGLSNELVWGLVIGVALYAASEMLQLGLIPIAFGIGLYVPMALSLPLFLGGIIRFAVERNGSSEGNARRTQKGAAAKATKKMEFGRIIAAGLISGAGLIAVILSMQSIPWGSLI